MQVVKDIAPYATLAGAALAVTFLVLVIVLWVKVRRSAPRPDAHPRAPRGARHRRPRDRPRRPGAQPARGGGAPHRRTRPPQEPARPLPDEPRHRASRRLRDAGGEQSASFALLDSHRSGVVFSAIAARDFARIYVKHLDEGSRPARPVPSVRRWPTPRPCRRPAPAGRGRPPRRGRRSRPPTSGAPPTSVRGTARHVPQPAPDIEVKAQPAPGGGAPAGRPPRAALCATTSTTSPGTSATPAPQNSGCRTGRCGPRRLTAAPVPEGAAMDPAVHV